jgi:acyl-CoA thioesterase-1
MGDSLSAAYGIELEQGWVNLLQIKLNQNQNEDKSWHLINASVTGETTAGAVARLPELLGKHKPQLCIIVLGANDGLRGMPVNNMQENLNKMIILCKQYGQVLLLGMRLPPNYGKKYTEEFKQSFELVAKKHKIAFVPFLFKGFANNRRDFQVDGYHPTADAQKKILANIWPILFLLLLE